MKSESSREVLSIPCRGKNYGIAFSYIVEICPDIRISRIPGLPEYYEGVCNYKGTIIPVVRLEADGKKPRDTHVILVIRQGKFEFGILLEEDPGMITIGEEGKIENQPEEAVSGICRIKAIYRKGENFYSLIDIEKTVEHLIVYA